MLFLVPAGTAAFAASARSLAVLFLFRSRSEAEERHQRISVAAILQKLPWEVLRQIQPSRRAPDWRHLDRGCHTGSTCACALESRNC
jgi:hypothetical protein